MSSTTEEAIEALETTVAANCCLAVACTLYAFERCIIFDQEVELMWRRKMSLATTVYVLMHASMLAVLFTSVALLIVQGCDSGYRLAIAEISSKIVFRWAIGAISALRVYAINGRTLVSPAAISLLFLAYTLYDFYNASHLFKLEAPPPVGCLILTTMRPEVEHGLHISSLVCAAVAEVLVLVATWRATYRARRAADSSSMRTSVSGMLLRDGTIYFGVILILLVLNAIFELTIPDISITSLTYVLQTVCISRLYLNLRHAATTSDILLTSPSRLHNIYFSRFVGSLDGSLVFESDSHLDEDAEAHSIFGVDDNKVMKSEDMAMSDMAFPTAAFDEAKAA
ncbi:hypothetical protein DAEQUDRAFT_810928 [Daedalea quercina L-15889]|uniref:DUF6533 domain-containing protein n=1 Tax=Daedalea quercina L-15889 TaxID=1314783 RepID=A0A165R2H7_9APHY|nr:hypothetical protein DAEQUDRAFT_810928 [Daedalea quercina L-15889]